VSDNEISSNPKPIGYFYEGYDKVKQDIGHDNQLEAYQFGFGQNQIGWFFHHGLGVKQDVQEALNIYKKLSDQLGAHFGQANLGQIYEEGSDKINKNPILALTWYEIAKENKVNTFNKNKVEQLSRSFDPDKLAQISKVVQQCKNKQFLNCFDLVIASNNPNIEDTKDTKNNTSTLANNSVNTNKPTIEIKQKRIALVIGNSNYAYSRLTNPINDAQDVSNILKKSGFEVIDQRNATLAEMVKSIRDFGDKLLGADVGLVYYSGHGVESKGHNYLIPVNATMAREDELAYQAVDANQILEKMNTAQKSVNILILDSCRDNPFTRSFRSTSRGLAQMDAPMGTFVAFSTSPGKTAADGEGRNSPFTKNLVQAISKSNSTIETVFKEVRKKVVEETKGQQVPWESSSLIGDFYFSRGQ
jgi:hypothetical protein